MSEIPEQARERRRGRRDLSLVHRLREPATAPSDPTDKSPLLLLLHGVGSNELAMAALAETFDDRFVIVSARAPIELESFSYAWIRVTFTSQGPVIDGDEASAAWGRMASFVDEAVDAYDCDPSRVFIVGFSQGGIMALATLLTAPERVTGAACMSGRLPPELLSHVADADRLRDKAVLLVHGVHDEVLPIDYARSARRTLGAWPLDLTYQEFDMGHTTTTASLATVSAWLSDRLGS